MQKKFLGIASLALIQVIIVGNLQVLPANAIYGFSLPWLYLLAIIGFFIPCNLMVAELATTRPQTGGAYIWCEQAFGPKVGFFTVTILWISNLLWYPSLFSLIAANFAYIVDPSLIQNKLFMISFSVILFWFFTALNCAGIQFSTRLSAWCSVIGIVLPMLIIIIGGVIWYVSGKPLAITAAQTPWLPNLFKLDNLGLVIAVVISLFGIELTAVHAGNVVNPKRDYPISMLISSLLVLCLLIGAELAIAIIIPKEQLSVMTGLLDALVQFFTSIKLTAFISLILLLVFLGNMGSAAAWMLASTRGMFIAAERNRVTNILRKTNKREAPVGVLLFEAIIFTLASTVFLLFSNVVASFWLLLALASQITLFYYVILFISAIRLRYLPSDVPGFQIPGGKLVLWGLMSLGALTSVLALLSGFLPPPGLGEADLQLFRMVMGAGLLFAFCLPWLLLCWQKNRPQDLTKAANCL